MMYQKPKAKPSAKKPAPARLAPVEGGGGYQAQPAPKPTEEKPKTTRPVRGRPAGV
jgi:hypothetical protein